MGVLLESEETLGLRHIEQDAQQVTRYVPQKYGYFALNLIKNSSLFKSILHIASLSIPPYLLAMSIVIFAMESFDGGDPVAARLIAFRGQEAIKGRHSVVLTILKDTKLHITSLVWLPWESPDTECDSVMSRLLPGYLTGFYPCPCGDSQWRWERWGRVAGKPTGFRHHMYCDIVCDACRQKARLNLCPDKTSHIPPIFLYPNNAVAPKPTNWLQDHFEMSILPSRWDENILWLRRKRDSY
jgi:hypothetical protein